MHITNMRFFFSMSVNVPCFGRMGIYPLKHRLLVSVCDTLDIHCTMYLILIFNLPLSKFFKLHM